MNYCRVLASRRSLHLELAHYGAYGTVALHCAMSALCMHAAACRALSISAADRSAAGTAARRRAGPSTLPLQRSSRSATMATPNLYDIGSVTDIDGKQFDLSSLKGKVVVVVNVACEW